MCFNIRTIVSLCLALTTMSYIPYALSQNVTSHEECIPINDIEKESTTGDSMSIPTNDQLFKPYGADLSFPMHNPVSTNYPWLPHNKCANNPTPPEYQGMPIQVLGDKRSVYENYLDGCKKRYPPGDECETCEQARIAMNLRQPQSMVNYTDIGFKKIRAPEELMNMLLEFWEKNKDKKTPEEWASGNCYVNHWENMSYMAHIEDSNLEGGGAALKQMIWDAAEGIIQEWTKQKKMKTSSLYGIRVYEEGAILATHVDRLPLVSSAIINVDQDVDEPWPLEVIGHDGRAYNVTMEPGDMVLYESHSILHGRPFPLKGRFFANVFIHFAPEGDEKSSDGRPSYVIEGSPEHIRMKETGKLNYSQKVRTRETEGNGAAHVAAARGDLKTLNIIAKHNKSELFQKDVNGWSPFFEAARNGKIEVLKFLMYHGQNILEVNKIGHSAYQISEDYDQIKSRKYLRNEWYMHNWGSLPRCLR